MEIKCDITYIYYFKLSCLFEKFGIMYDLDFCMQQIISNYFVLVH